MNDSNPLVSAPITELEKFMSGVDEFVNQLFDSHSPYPDGGQKYTASKVIRDAVHNLQRFAPHEMEIIDSPILQRLRHIHQTATAFMVYPSAHHTRFEHSLGVTSIAGQIVNSLRMQNHEITPKDEAELRIAALLHDTGHCLFSHLSESIIEDRFHRELHDIRRELISSGIVKKEVGFAELCSFFIVRSTRFRRFWDSVRGPVDAEIDRIADLILGQAPSGDLSKQFLADIISGSFDADKLDYFARDAHSTGVKVVLDTERILHSFTLVESKGDIRSLAIRRAGIPHVEQILLARTMLYSSIYHHHKVRAAECMVRSVFERLWDQQLEEEFHLKNPTDFLSLSEHDFFSKLSKHDALAQSIAQFQRRRMLKRVLMLNGSTVSTDPEHNPEAKDNFEFMKLFDDGTIRLASGQSVTPTQYLRSIRQRIFNSLNPKDKLGASVYDLWIDMPTSVPFGSGASSGLVELQPGLAPQPMHTVLPVDAWLKAYQQTKWGGHAFYLSEDENIRSSVGYITRAILAARLNISIEDSAVSMCLKLPAQI